MNDAILSPVINKRLLLSSKKEAIKIKAKAQNILIVFDSLISSLTFSRSLTVEEESELIDELIVDIAADNTPTNRIPLIPGSKK